MEEDMVQFEILWNCQNMTQWQEVKICWWKNHSNRLVHPKVTTNIQFVKAVICATQIKHRSAEHSSAQLSSPFTGGRGGGQWVPNQSGLHRKTPA
jgi:hypothetical protein